MQTRPNSAKTAAQKHDVATGIDYSQCIKHLLFAVVVGVVCGLASVVLCLCVGWSYDLFKDFKWLIWALPVFGVFELALYKWWKLRPDMTTHRVIMHMRDNKPVSYFLAPGILLGTCMTILGGGSVGKEAGALQMGASLGSLVSRPFKLRSIYRRNYDEKLNDAVAATGMAACFSALFFAPLGSCMFVLELMRFKKSVTRHFVSMLVACFVAFFIASTIGIGDIITKVAFPLIDWRVVGQCVVIGVAAAIFGTIFDSVIHWIHDLTWRLSKNYFLWVIVGGLLFAAIITIFNLDYLTGSGGDTLNRVLNGRFGAWDFLIKAILTAICLGFWFKGGEIMPSFCIGGLLGASCSYLSGGDAVFGAAVGVVSFFAAFSRCPLAAFLMGCEIFGWQGALFFVIGIVVAYMFGSPVGMYGEGIDRAIRTRWSTAFGHIRQERIKNEAEYVGAIQKTTAFLEGIKNTLDAPDDKVPASGEMKSEVEAKPKTAVNSDEAHS